MQKIIAVVCGLWFVAAAAGLAVHSFSPGGLKPALLESLLVLALVLAFFACPSVTRFFLSLSGPLKIFSAVFFFLMIGGQAVSIDTAAFPFVSWTMYGQTDAGPVARFVECRGATRSGGRVPLNPERLFPSVRKNMLGASISRLDRAFGPDLELRGGTDKPDTGPLRRLKNFLRPYPDLDRDEMKKRLGEIFEALAFRYNSAHPEDPVTAVELLHGSVNIDDTPDPRPAYEVAGVYDLAERRFR